MPKCEYHEDYVQLLSGLKEYMGMVERNLESNIKSVGDKTDIAFDKIESIKEQISEQAKDHRETATYVKELYRQFDKLTIQMSNIVDKLDTYITAIAAVKNTADSNLAFTKSGKQMAFEIVKWVVLLGLGAALTNLGR